MITKTEILTTYIEMRKRHPDPVSWATSQDIDVHGLMEMVIESVDEFRRGLGKSPAPETAFAMGFSAGFETAKKALSDSHDH